MNLINSSLEKAFIIKPISDEKLNNYSNYYEHGIFLNEFFVTETDLKNVPDKIDGIILSHSDKEQILTDILEFDARGVSFAINKSNQIERHQLNESLEIKKSLVLIDQVEFFMANNE